MENKAFNFTGTRYVVTHLEAGYPRTDVIFNLETLGSLCHNYCRIGFKIESIVAQKWDYATQRWQSID